jgi:ATP-dependent protease ClpP protease subunit
MVDYMKRDCGSKIRALARNLRITAKQLKALMNGTKWMTPKEAMKIGLIDGIWTASMERRVG